MKKLLLLILLGIILLIGCSSEQKDIDLSENPSDTKQVLFSEKFLNLSGEDAEGLINYLDDLGEDYYEELDSNSEDTVYMIISEEQKIHWDNVIFEKLNQKEEDLKQVSDKFYAEYSDNHEQINIYYDITMRFESAFDYIRDASIYCAMYQLLHGSKEFSITLNIYNVDTGKLVVGGKLEEDVSYDNTEWSASYQVTDEEAKQIEENNSNAQSYILNSTFVDAISVIDILCNATGNDYSYLYINENGKAVVGLSEEQKSKCLVKADSYIDSICTQFTDLNSQYSIQLNDDYSVLKFYFDENLSKQDQSNYFIYTETLTMISQILLNNTNEFYIDINIYDSDSGELISNGNTENGISWNVGE